MLFYQFEVVRNSPFTRSGPAREAKIMIRVDADVECSTAAAVDYLRNRGWEITNVRRAQQADDPAEFAGDPSAVQLYQDAADTGMACAIVARRTGTVGPRPAELAHA